jgi:hypothetical protein
LINVDQNGGLVDDRVVTVLDDHRAALAELWRTFADLEAATYSPLYATIARGVADDHDLLGLVLDAPPRAHYPLTLLASVHDLVLAGVDHPIVEVYAGRSADDPVPLFRDICLVHREQLLATMSTRHIQTNECGRSAVLGLGLATIAAEFGAPGVLLDAGASAGLNLLYDRYALDYGPLGQRGDSRSPVRVSCQIRTPGFRVPQIPDVPVRVGIDRAPIDVRDARDIRWLLACVWPDTGRLDRTAAALELATAARPSVRQGDMVSDIPALLDEVGGDGLTVVLTSLAYTYLDPSRRPTFVDHLAAAAARRPLVWLSLEPAGVVERISPPAIPQGDDVHPVVLGLSCFGAAGDGARALALVHPHGSWLEWT